jgi:predicted nucleic acid-binding protein
MILTLDNEYAAVLDACVLAPMPLCDTLLRCAEEPALYRVLWSDQTLEEVDRTLQKFRYTPEQSARRLRKMREAFPEASISVPPQLLAAVPGLPDANDRHVAAAAIQGRAEVIVTSNLKHFPREVLAPYGILVHSPDDFLLHQFHLNPDRVLDVLDTQASAIRQQRLDILNRLRVSLPQFAELVARRI